MATVKNNLKRQLLANQLQQKINENIEVKYRKAVSDFFQKQMNLVLTAFDEYYNEIMLLQGQVDLILAPIHETQKEYHDLLLQHNKEIYNRGRKQGRRLVERQTKARESLKAKKPIGFLHDNENKYTQHFGTLPTTEQYLESYTFTASESTMNRVDSEINDILNTGYKEGWGVADVRNRIQERYSQISTWEANRIARTEMHTAHNMGVMQTYQEMGVEYKEWRSAHDKRVRTSHRYMDGEIVPLDEPFSNKLMYPGDKTGKIKEWINCRCSVMPYLLPPGTMAPVGRSSFRDNEIWGKKQPNYDKLLENETGGAVNWRQYRDILHGKTLEQVGIGKQHTNEYNITQTDLELLSQQTGIPVKELTTYSNEKLYEMLKQYGLI